MLSSKRKRQAESRASSEAASHPTFEDAWQMEVKFSLPTSITVHDHLEVRGQTTMMQVALPPIFVTVRPLASGDEEALSAFGLHGLSDESRRLFAPYDWSAPSPTLLAAFRSSIANSQSRRDLHLIALSGGKVCCHGFLSSMCEEIPVLGIAVVDAWHGRGLARQMMSLLERAGVAEGKPAIEVTTMQDNERARSVCLRAGYEELGIIRRPLGVDVTAAFAGSVAATSFRDERQMCRVLDEEARPRVLEAMAAKRRRAAELFGARADRA